MPHMWKKYGEITVLQPLKSPHSLMITITGWVELTCLTSWLHITILTSNASAHGFPCFYNLTPSSEAILIWSTNLNSITNQGPEWMCFRTSHLLWPWFSASYKKPNTYSGSRMTSDLLPQVLQLFAPPQQTLQPVAPSFNLPLLTLLPLPPHRYLLTAYHLLHIE